ncbi:MAG TPA: TolC family protein [Polyangia bacterium]|nr:TolC family protein [Polyangia bacterium]
MRARSEAKVLILGAVTAVIWPSWRAAAASGGDETAADRELATEARLPTVLRVIADRNPDLREADQRAGASEAKVGASARLPDPELKTELWGQPLARPVSFGDAQTIMIGLRQSFPAWGSLDARARAAREDAAAALDGAEARRQDVAAQARRAFAAYARADRELRLHLEHVGLASRVVEIARALYQAGHGSQQDLLRAQSELSRLHVDVAGIEQQRTSAAAMLNALMDRAPEAALGPVAETEDAATSEEPTEDLGDADGKLDQRRPELRAAARAVTRSEADADVARREASRPSFMVGADYWLMPSFATHNAYGAMVSMSLPWLNPGRRDEVKAAERAGAADRSALRAQQVMARYQLHDAAAKVRAARETLRLIHGRVLADARRSFESAEAAFQSGQGGVTSVLDAARGLLEVRVDEVRALAELDTSRADYDRAAGLSVAGLTGEPRR